MLEKCAEGDDDLEDGEILEEGEVPDDDEEENNENIKKDSNSNTENTNKKAIDSVTPKGFGQNSNQFNSNQFGPNNGSQFNSQFGGNQFNSSNQFNSASRISNDKKRKKRWDDGVESNADFKEKKFRKTDERALSPPGDEDEDFDEDDFMCVRGASPSREVGKSGHGANRESPPPLGQQDFYPPDYDYDEPDDDNGPNGPPDFRRNKPNSNFRGGGGRGGGRRGNDNRRGGRGGRGGRDGWRGGRGGMGERGERGGDNDDGHTDMNGICQYFMQGKCHRGDNCPYSHDAIPPRKMELCKFYLLECCAKKDKCLYMHGDFPCKYYHTGLQCFAFEAGECKFSHGPLDDVHRNILLKHLETAPKEILGDFPRLSREGALAMMKNKEANTPIPSLFDIKFNKSDPGKHNMDKDNSNSNTTPIPSDEDTQDNPNNPLLPTPGFPANQFPPFQQKFPGQFPNQFSGPPGNQFFQNNQFPPNPFGPNPFPANQFQQQQFSQSNQPDRQPHHHHHKSEKDTDKRALSMDKDERAFDRDERDNGRHKADKDHRDKDDKDHRSKDDKDHRDKDDDRDKDDEEDDREERREKRKKEREQHKADKAKRKAEREAKRAAKKRKMEGKKKERRRGSDEDEEEDGSDGETRDDKRTSKDRKHKKRRRGTSKSEEEGEGDSVLAHLPKTQRELYLRIQQHQREVGTSVASNSADDSGGGDSTPPGGAEEHWYSSDEENPGSSLASLVQTINQKSKPPLLPHPPAKVPLLPTPTNIPNTPGYIEPKPESGFGASNAPTGSEANPSMILNFPNININQDEVSRLLSTLQSVSVPSSSTQPVSSQPDNQGSLGSIPFPGQNPGGPLNIPLPGSNASGNGSNALGMSNNGSNALGMSNNGSNMSTSANGSNNLAMSGNGMPMGNMPSGNAMPPFGAAGPNFPPPTGPGFPGMPLPSMMGGNMSFPLPPPSGPSLPSEPAKPPLVKRDPRLSRSSAPDLPRPLVEPTPPAPAKPADPMSLLKDIDLRLPTLSSSLGTPASSGDVDLRNLIQAVPMHEACKEIDASLGSHPPLTWSLRRWHRVPCNYAEIVPLVKANPQDPRLNPARIGRRRRSSDDIPASPIVPPSPNSTASASPNTRDPRKSTALGAMLRPGVESSRRPADPRMGERRNSDPRQGEPRPDPRQMGDPRFSVGGDALPAKDRYPADPRVKRASDPRMPDDYRYQPSYSQDSDLRSSHRGDSRSEGKFQDTDLRMTPQSGYSHHHQS
ncbi:hypothetical protein M8J77_000976 [Diaphorina citri]|nr:hypothetical protein M8J77_000976 [Diaphorina citri]